MAEPATIPEAAADHAQAGQANSSANVVREGQTVVLEVNGEKQAFILVKRNGRMKVGKSYCSLDPIIGKPYGSLFTLVGDGADLEETQRDLLEDWDEVGEVEKDNRNLVDQNANQKLTAEDIAEMRQAGMGGDEIIAALQANSATFSSKTQFSQDKYRKRKMKKYCMQATVHRPTARSIAEVYFSKSPAKINHLRVDTLAIMLSLANVGAYSNVLVMENCSGLVTAAVAERLGGFGHVCSTYIGARPLPLGAVGLLNISDAIKDSMSSAPLAKLLQHQQASSSGQAGSDAAAVSAEPGPSTAQQASSATVPATAAAKSSQLSDGAALQHAAAGPSASAQQSESEVPAQDTAPGSKALPAAADGSAPEEHAAKRAKLTGEPASGPAAEAAVAPSIQPAAANAACGEPAAAVGAGLDALIPAETPGQHAAGHDVDGKGGNTAEQAEGEDVAMPDADADAGAADLGPPAANGASAAQPKQRTGPRVSDATLRRYCQRGFSSCLVAAPGIHPTAAMRKLLPLLSPSATFAIYSPWSAPLADCMAHLQQAKQAVALQLQESWWREHQVLPSRTHPTMSMSGTGGYILSGIRVAP